MTKFSINPSEVAVVASTLYPKWYSGSLRSIKHTDKIRGDLALEMFRKARELGHHSIVVDGGSPKTFLKTLSNIDGLIIKKMKSHKRSVKRIMAIRTASKIAGVKAIILTEPEKVSFIADCVPALVKPILEGSVDVVVPKREEKLFKETYPDYMYDSEIEGNTLYNEELRAHDLLSIKDEDLDMFFGPKVFKNDKRLLNLLLRRYKANTLKMLFSGILLFDVDEYSNALFFPVINALRKKKNVVSITIPFKYPKLQKDNETKGNKELFILKRKYQRLTLLIELMHFLGYLDKNKNARLKLETR